MAVKLANCCWTSARHSWVLLWSYCLAISLLVLSQFSSFKSWSIFFFCHTSLWIKVNRGFTSFEASVGVAGARPWNWHDSASSDQNKSYNEPWQLLNGNSVWANGQEERSHNALISDNNLPCSSSCDFSQITRRQPVPVFSPSVLTIPLDCFHNLCLHVTKLSRVTEWPTQHTNPSLVGIVIVRRRVMRSPLTENIALLMWSPHCVYMDFSGEFLFLPPVLFVFRHHILEYS